MMKDISMEIRSLGANNAILVALLDKKPESDGKIRWQQGDQITIGNGASIRYDRQVVYESEGVAEPITFTIGFVSGIVGNLIASYIYDKLKPYQEKVKEIKVNGKSIPLSKDELAKAFLQDIDDLEKRER